MRRAEMFVELVSILALLGFAIGVHTDQDGGDLEARSAQPQPSWVDLNPLPFGGVPHEEDVVVEKSPLDTLITRASNTADSTEQNDWSLESMLTEAPVAHITSSSSDESWKKRPDRELHHHPQPYASSSSEDDYYSTARSSVSSTSSEGYDESSSSSFDHTRSHKYGQSVSSVFTSNSEYGDGSSQSSSNEHLCDLEDKHIHLVNDKRVYSQDKLSTISSHQQYFLLCIHRNPRDWHWPKFSFNCRAYWHNFDIFECYSVHKLAGDILVGWHDNIISWACGDKYDNGTLPSG
ncbi:hypothetical protein N8I77_010484 [Diaporthe amygdali]|uniref:Uncharacterized protein n=1 Tax=Phomopsis amygdali TaxID=1214568 RepID=A0AAD9W122_PHOAM|nr:hypothetical protein N8I77_010484 [Diaporthe amygdali]